MSPFWILLGTVLHRRRSVTLWTCTADTSFPSGSNVCRLMIGTAEFGWRGWHPFGQNISHLGLKEVLTIVDVIQEGLSARGIKDMSIHIDAIAHNEETFLEIRKGFQDIIYAPCHPPCLTEWLDKWNTPLSDVLSASPVTNLPRAPSTHGRAPSGPIDLTGDASHPLSTNQSTVAFSATHVAAPPTHIDLTDEVNDMPGYGDGQHQNDHHTVVLWMMEMRFY